MVTRVSPNYKKTVGRKKGVPNKDRRMLAERLKEKFGGWCPIEAMGMIAQDVTVDMPVRVSAAKEVAQYMHPKLRAIEHTGGENPIQLEQTVRVVRYPLKAERPEGF